MSLIEQAAKRLEELRRAGAAPAEQDMRTSDVTPTPEAVVRALEARREATAEAFAGGAANAAGGLSQAVRMASALTEPGADDSFIITGKPSRTSRTVEVKLDQLKARGYVTPDAPKTQVADEFRVIKRPIIRNAQGRGGAKVKNGNLVMVTSALPGEGKTFTALNLAMSVAMEYDSTVLLVDGDVAHPSLPGLLGVADAPGLLDLLTNDKLDVADVLLKTNVDKLSVMPAGSPHRRSTELLASGQMASLLRELGSRYSDRIIIFDSPPLLVTTEARVMATHMGQIIMVVAAESTSQNLLNQALATIESCEIVLMMLNKASPGVARTYGYYADDAGRG